MSFDTPDDPHSRGTALARLLARALKSQAEPAGHAKSSACPDAEALAAYVDHGLAEEETARWESHFADCSRCQTIIAVLAATGEELTTAEVERLGSLAAASSVAREPVVQNTTAPWIAIWRRPALWRWLVPTVGIASAAALWLALRQAPPRQALDSQRIAATTGAPQNKINEGAGAATSAKPDETQIAQSNLPAPLVPSPSSGALLRDKEKAEAHSSLTTKKEALEKQEGVRSAAQAGSEAERKAEAREEAAKDKRVSSAAADEQKSQTVDVLGAAPPVATAEAPSASTSARNDARAAPPSFDAASGAPAPAQLKALAQTASQAIVFGSPNRRALWRLGSGGRIEHSIDQGQTWQPQASGVTADLLAGTAPSEKIAWAVGRAGIIVRTEDGEHWQRVAPPSATQPLTPPVPAPDWISIEARDALHATISSRDLRRFVTEDGGRTWVQEP